MATRKILNTVLTVALAMGTASCGIFGGGDGGGKRLESRTYALGVNGYLWRAALDTLAFLPLEQADGSSGVILSDWYINPDLPRERIKVSVFILDRDLRADALSVNVFREELENGAWVARAVRAGTVEKIENAILNRARQLRRGAEG